MHSKEVAHDEQEHTVLKKLRDLILSAAFEPDKKLTAEKLAERLCVSRTPIRNALVVLESEGLVAYSKNKGFTARRFGKKDILDAIETRASLVATAARILAEKGVLDAVMHSAREIVSCAQKCLDEGDWSRASQKQWFDCNYSLHRLLVKETGNIYLMKALTVTLNVPLQQELIDLSPLTRPGRSTGKPKKATEIPKHIIQAQYYHEQVLRLIASRQAMRVYNLMYEYIISGKDQVEMIDID